MNNKCNNCKRDLSYSERWDAYFCDYCNMWCEKKCDDPECWFCDERPETPHNEIIWL